ncbi:conserved Plasmodium protein, unknown function [Plasmodium chabaudi adami]|uniref:Uncharacterized protein n=1 Tax=Plasmodium chabaudi adami TaxID=5826 RepID=A0A1D3LLH0_PLACE|nr:conserved Plasmodium protein, unknown function [Plasmodium chabaudi adami]
MDSSPISIDNTSSKNYDEMRNMNYSDFHVQTKIIENIDGEHSDKNSDDSCTDYGGENRETEGYNNDIASEKYEEKFEGDFMSGDEYVESSAASNYGKYKDINPDDLISFYEKESNEDIKDDESIKTNKIDHYLDKNYKGEIIIDGKNEVDEFLLVSRMAYYDIANQSKDKIYENKENNSLYFLKDQASKECTNEDDYDGEHNHGPLLASPKKTLNNNSKDIESICNNMRDSQHEGKNPFNTNQANIDNIGKQYTDNSSEESECETRSICSFQNDKDEIADDDSNSNSQTEVLDNEASKKCDNGEKKKSKVRSHIIPHTGKYEKEDRIRLMGIPEYVQKGLKIEKIGRLIKKDNDILTIHSLNSKYYLSAASVLCLENRKIIGCIVDVCSNETEVFYYVKLVFPSLEAEIKENIDIYADLKHSLYINVGTGLCSELFKVLKNKSVPYIFINYNDLYNISETQLMEKHSDTNSGNNNNNPNDNKGNNGKRDERNNNNKDKKRKKNFKGQNKNLQIFNNGKNNRKNNPNNIVNTNSENNNIIPYEKSGKMNHSRKYKKGKDFGNLPSSSQNMNLKFKNLSYVNNSNINEMGNMISKRGHNNSNVGKNNAYNIGHDNNPNNTNYMYANHSLNNIGNMGTLNNSNQNEYNAFHNATHNYKKHKMHNYNMNYANIYNNHQNNVNMAYPNESSNHMHPQNYYDIHRTNFINFNNPPNLDNKMQNIIYPQPMEPGSNSYINRPPTNWNSDHISHNKYNDNYTNYINGQEKYTYISQKSYNNKIPQEPINKIMFNNNNDIPSNYNSININNLYNYNDFNSKN